MPSSGAKDVVVTVPGRPAGTLAGGFTVDPYVMATQIVGDQANDVAVNSVTQRVFAVSRNAGTVKVFDAMTGASIGTPIGGLITPMAVAVNPTTNRIYVTRKSPNGVTVIDGAGTNYGAGSSIGTPIAVTNPQAMAVQSATNRLYVISQSGNSLSSIDMAGSGNSGAGTLLAGTLPTGTSPNALALFAGAVTRLFVVNLTSANLTIIVP